MPFLALAWPFLKTWWKVIVPVVLVLLALGYVKILHLQIDHYKAEAAEMRIVIAQANEKNQQLEEAAEALTKKYERQLQNKQLEEDRKLKTTVERIKKDEESKRIALTRTLIELFNDSKPNNDPVTTTKPVDVGGTGPPKEAVTLNELLLISAENDSNHIKCINQVHEWQNFWKDYESQVKVVGGSP